MCSECGHLYVWTPAVYLEKPGAPSVAELEEMRAYAKSKGVPVLMGYNKNVTPYVRKALEFAKSTPAAAHTTYVSALTSLTPPPPPTQFSHPLVLSPVCYTPILPICHPPPPHGSNLSHTPIFSDSSLTLL